jgi:hypothetical protein
MNQRPKTTPPRGQVTQTSVHAHWSKLPPERRHALMIALTAMMVKRLPGRRHPQEVHDA